MAYTNSSLVNYTRLSPNHSGQRNHTIDTISIHCVVGQCSVETLGSIFADPSKEASSNYGIGYDGKIGLYVEEKNRSWCTSSSSNDNRAITIEVASDTKHPYAVNDKAYNALIKLLADICKRNNIKSLKWKGDKSLIGQVDKQNMTVHRWFANKACPGDYLYNRHGQIADEVNKLLGSSVSSTPTTSTSTNKATSSSTTSKTTSKPDVYYKVKVGGKWFPEVKNLEDFAGIKGKSITDVAIKVSKGSVKYRVHIKGGNWLPYVTGYNINDHINGYAGNGKVIDAIEIVYYTPDDVKKQHGYLKAKYRVSPVNGNYYSYQLDNEKTNGQDGYAGSFGQAIDRLQICLA